MTASDTDAWPERPEDEDFGPSKTQIKRDMQELQTLGTAILNLPTEQIQALAVDETLREALLEAQRITAHGARKRQLQYVGKLLRSRDPEPLRQALGRWQAGRNRQTKAFHAIEDWREMLLNSDATVAEWLQQYPESDTKAFRSLLRSARNEFQQQPDTARKGKSFRLLFKHIRDTIEASDI